MTTPDRDMRERARAARQAKDLEELSGALDWLYNQIHEIVTTKEEP